MKRHTMPLAVALVATIMGMNAATAQDVADLDVEAKFNELLPGMGAEKMADRRAPQSEWETICFRLGAPGLEAKRKLACELMAAKLTDDTPIDARVWLLKQLERHGDEECVDAIAGQLDDPSPRILDSACRALANNPSEKVEALLLKAAEDATNVEMKVALDAALTYRLRPAAVITLVDELDRAANAEQTVERLLAAYESDDALDRSTALGYVERLDSAEIAELSKRVSNLDAALQPPMLVMLGSCRDGAALAAVLEATKSDDEAVRVAAIEALGGVGDAGTVPMLIEAMLAGGPTGDGARRALEATFAPGVDEKLIALMQSTDDMGRRAMLIEMLDRRRAASAVPALLRQLQGEDRGVYDRAMRALAKLASADQVAEIITSSLAASSSSIPDADQRAIVEICLRIPGDENDADPVLTEYSQGVPELKLALLPVLGRIGGAKALSAVREAVASGDKARVEAGVIALSNWPTAEVAEDLATLAEKLQDEGLKIRVIRGLARVVVLDQMHSDADELAFLKRVMKQATRDDERRLILDRARDARTFDAVFFAAEYLDADAKVADQACKTIVDLLHRSEIRSQKPEESDKLLKRVMATTKNEGLAKDAAKYLSTAQ